MDPCVRECRHAWFLRDVVQRPTTRVDLGHRARERGVGCFEQYAEGETADAQNR